MLGLPPIVLTSASNGTSSSITVGESFSICLPENPTTGYRWELDSPDTSILKIQEDRYNSDSIMQAGAGGVHTFIFQGIAPGTTKVSIRLRRPWEGEDSAADLFSLTVVTEPVDFPRTI